MGPRGGGASNPLNPTYSYLGGTQTRLGQGLGYFNWEKSVGLAIGAALNGSTDVICLREGDSTDQGYGSGTAGANTRSTSIPTKSANTMNAAGIPANADGFLGLTGVAAASYTAYNDQCTFVGAAWAAAPGASAGGFGWTAPSSGSALVYVFPNNFDIVDIWDIEAGTGTRQWSSDFSAARTNLLTTTVGSSNKLTKVTRTGFGTQTRINFLEVAGSIYIQGCVPRMSSAPVLKVVNAGRQSWSTADWLTITNLYSSRNAVKDFIATYVALPLPVIVMVNLGINDWETGSGIDAATYETNLGTIAQDIIDSGGLPILIVPVPSNPTITQTQSAYGDAVYNVAIAKNLPVIDRTAKFVDFATADAAGYMDDDKHPNGTGCQVLATHESDIFVLVKSAT